MKSWVQKSFTKIRSILNEREDELLLNIDKNFDNIFFNKNLIFENEKLPDKKKILLEKSKNAENEWGARVCCCPWTTGKCPCYSILEWQGVYL